MNAGPFDPRTLFEGGAPDAPLIAVDALTATFGGGKTVTANLVTRLAALRPAWNFAVLASHRDALEPSAVPSNLRRLDFPALASAPRRWAYEQLRLPGLLKTLRADLLLNFGGFACFGTSVPQVSVWQNPNILSDEPIGRNLRTRAYIRAQRAAQALSLPRARFHLFPTREALRLARALWPMDRYPHRAIHWGADPNARARESTAPLEGREDFALAVGHTYFHKNYEVLIDAMAHLAGRGDNGLRLEIAGGIYDARHFEALERRVRAAGLDERVRFHGALPGAAVADLYRRARVYVTTSLLESFGLTTLEAMSHGLPVLAGKASCLPEVCGDAALYCDPRDPVDVAERLHELASDPELARHYRERGFERLRHFRWDATADEYARVLDAVLQDPEHPQVRERGEAAEAAPRPGR